MLFCLSSSDFMNKDTNNNLIIRFQYVKIYECHETDPDYQLHKTILRFFPAFSNIFSFM
jgi:hypothetical protein